MLFKYAEIQRAVRFVMGYKIDEKSATEYYFKNPYTEKETFS